MTKTCERCDGYGVNLHQLLRETCRHCEGTGEVEIVCEFCGVALERGDVDICDRCAEDFDRQDREYQASLSCEHCSAVGGGCIVCVPTVAVVGREAISVDGSVKV